MVRLGCLSLILFFVLILLFPLFLADIMSTALMRLGLSPRTSLLLVVGIFVGGMMNIPVKKIPRDEVYEINPSGLLGLDRLFHHSAALRPYTLIAVNVGGCVIPVLIAAYELLRLAGLPGGVLMTGLVGIALNTAVCYYLARPVSGIGIAMPAFVPGLVAAAYALLFAPEAAPAVAFTAGVLGPLIGADLLHLREIGRVSTGFASIGGAGTFDGIVISGLLAALLA
ncbi:DUF1614 domain-containing protein [Kiritimatiella glycovorans]|uniref:Putative membrane protein n=1 Tax=Kiritimatiella glycovorans TaxID=1307763 RepID=A0A0G3EH62_9BACT|nr:DUF1614 domain-containing protein [Kiritimatiella glycovorans]AKJ64757.1 putative membrane protein [Kiritimatiella glycovorans]